MNASPRTLGELFREQAKRGADRVALRYKLGGTWRTKSWNEWLATSSEVAAGLVALGAQPGDAIGIMASTRLQWVEADAGTLLAGCVTVPIYPTVLADTVEVIVRDAKLGVLFVEDPLALEKLIVGAGPGRALLEGVRYVVLFDRTKRLDLPDSYGRLDLHVDDVVPAPLRQRVLSFSEFLELGRERLDVSSVELEKRSREVKPESPASILYTSGTTGVPRGVTLSHANFLYEVREVEKAFDVTEKDQQLTYLPLAHVLGKVTIVLQWQVGFVTAFAESMLSAVDDCAEVRPTFIVTVPRLFEKVKETVVRSATQTGDARKALFEWALAVGKRATELGRQGRAPTGLLAIERRYAQKLCFEPIQARFGGKLRFIVSGGAPLPLDVAEFFDSVGLPMYEGYGLTETTGAAFVNRPGTFRFGTVGRALPGVEARIADDGEVWLRGPNVTPGYFGSGTGDATHLDSDGWLHTGDVGTLDEDGYLTITDRKKDVIVTASGKNVAPQHIERMIEEHPAISRAVVLGDRRPYLVALIYLKPEAVTSVAPDFDSASAARVLAEQAIQSANTRLASYEQVKRFAILAHDLSQEHGELTPTLKVRRHIVDERYRSRLDELYRS